MIATKLKAMPSSQGNQASKKKRKLKWRTIRKSRNEELSSDLRFLGETNKIVADATPDRDKSDKEVIDGRSWGNFRPRWRFCSWSYRVSI